MKVGLIFEDFVNDMYGAFVIQDDHGCPMFFHLMFAVEKIYLNIFCMFYSNVVHTCNWKCSCCIFLILGWSRCSLDVATDSLVLRTGLNLSDDEQALVSFKLSRPN